MIDLSVIMAACNEEESFVREAVSSLRESLSVSAQIILVDDGSDRPIPQIEGVTVVHQENGGVGSAFRKGLEVAESDNIFLQGIDIRYLKNGWDIKAIEEIKNHPKAITCTSCVGLNKGNKDIEQRAKVSRRNGSNLLLFHDHHTHPKKPPDFRSILEAQWLPASQEKESFEIPCPLGAAYAASRSWLQEIDIWWGHRSWGSLEPLCSLQSWLLGGSCRVAPDIITAHYFSRNGNGKNKSQHLIYNKLLICHLLFTEKDRDRLIDFLGENHQVIEAKKMILQNKKAIDKKRAEYEKKLTLPLEEYCHKFNIEYRD